MLRRVRAERRPHATIRHAPPIDPGKPPGVAPEPLNAPAPIGRIRERIGKKNH